ncbi:hypothetical protein CVT26_007914 [Gymnopilus dilepis]|uniref:Uncharacterized protein n=1 Tax=Gymnopilus dilepis TaxID=231916 RepID=A0A409X133_9AGAR|nr:hypothetical protein CVT26_007914 [Gymnopilus dilepis]
MRLSLFAAVSTFLAIVGAEIAPAPQPAHALHQITREELTARAKHPDLFKKRDDGDSSPSDTPVIPCRYPLKRRDFSVVEQVLTPREMASFLLGRGSFTSENGTTYVDEQYAKLLEDSVDPNAGWYRRIYNEVKDSVGKKLLEVSIPRYKKWKSRLMHGDLIYLSTMTAIRSEDLDELERTLLDNPDFTDIQVHGFRLTRRFFEVANSY